MYSAKRLVWHIESDVQYLRANEVLRVTQYDPEQPVWSTDLTHYGIEGIMCHT